MTYDNAKLKIAVTNWLETSCTTGYGEELSSDLLTSFNRHCRKTHDLKRSPGRVAFGQQLREFGFDHRKLAGLAYWSGLELIKRPKVTAPRVYQKTKIQASDRKDEKLAYSENAEVNKRDKRKKRIRKFKKTTARETADKFRAVGGVTNKTD